MEDKKAITVRTTALSELRQELFDELCGLVRGPVYRTGDEMFVERTKMFNGNVRTIAKALVRPLDASDVSRIVLFCNKYNLSPSVKSGGYGTAGWAIGGDIIIDVTLIRDIDIEPPQEDRQRGYTGLRDMLVATSKGKGKAAAGLASFNTKIPDPSLDALIGQKRRRDDAEEDKEERAAYDARLRSYDTAAPELSSFLSGPALIPDPNYVVREMPKHMPTRVPASADSSSDTDSGSSGSMIVRQSSQSTTGTSPDPQSSPSHEPKESENRLSSSRSDPFGYLDEPAPLSSLSRSSLAQSTFHPSYQPWAASSIPTASSSSVGPPSASTNLFSAFDIFNAAPQVGNLEPVHPHAFVTFGAGMKQKEIDIHTASNPLAARPVLMAEGEDRRQLNASLPYHVPTAAHPCGSTIMLLGGFGFLSRLYGLSIDNLVEVEMVLADGRIVIANEEENEDLWWALRGAGPSLGIATRYKAKAFPVPVVFAGNLLYRFHRATAPSLIRHFRDCVKQAPRELYANVFLTAGPADKDSLVVIQMCYAGPKEKGMEYLQALSSWDGERCLLNEVNGKSFLSQQDSVAQVLRGRVGRQWYIRSALITSLPDDVINKTVIQFADTPIGCTWLFELAGGAISDFEDTCLPKEQREASFTIAALHQWEMGVDDPRCILSAEEWLHETMTPVVVGGPYPSFLGRHEPAARTQACFGKNWSRLVEIKQKYDPSNVFKNTFWPLDKDGDVVEPHSHEPPTP